MQKKMKVKNIRAIDNRLLGELDNFLAKRKGLSPSGAA